MEVGCLRARRRLSYLEGDTASAVFVCICIYRIARCGFFSLCTRRVCFGSAICIVRKERRDTGLRDRHTHSNFVLEELAVPDRYRNVF